MAYTALQLINRSFFLSQVVSRNLQTPTGDQVTDGLYMLNALLDIKSVDLHLIPYFTFYTFDTVAQQESYFVPSLLYVDSMTFNIGTVRYSMEEMTRKGYFSTPRVDDTYSLPFSYRVERAYDTDTETTGANVFMYFVPDNAYTIKIWGKFGLEEVSLSTDLETIYDPFYIEYLRYALADYICGEWGVTLPDASRRRLAEYIKKLRMTSPPDLSMQKRTYFNSKPGLDWQLCNIPGWLPY